MCYFSNWGIPIETATGSSEKASYAGPACRGQEEAKRVSRSAPLVPPAGHNGRAARHRGPVSKARRPQAPAVTREGEFAVSGPLGHVVAVDLSDHLSGQYASRLLAALGAEVLQVEPPGGSHVRSLPPKSTATGESFLYRVLARGKEIYPVEQGLEEIRRRLGRADMVVTSPTGVTIEPAVGGTGRQVTGLVSDFGTTGPRASWRGSEMVHQALGGAMYVTGDPLRKPLYGCSYRSYFATGLALFSGLLAAMQVRGHGGELVSQLVEVSVAETAASMSQNGATVYNYNGQWQRRGEYPGLMARVRCRDGWVVVFALRHWKELCDAFGLPEMGSDPRYASPAARTQNWSSALAAFEEAASQMHADDLVQRAQSGRGCVERMNTLEDVLRSEQFVARHFVGSEGQELRIGPAWRLTGSSEWRR
jgi:CoA:oxalate CoA-transferase